LNFAAEDGGEVGDGVVVAGVEMAGGEGFFILAG